MSKTTTQNWSHPCAPLMTACRSTTALPDCGKQVLRCAVNRYAGAAELEDAWIRAYLGEDGFVTGKDVEAAAPAQ